MKTLTVERLEELFVEEMKNSSNFNQKEKFRQQHVGSSATLIQLIAEMNGTDFTTENYRLVPKYQHLWS